MGHASDACSTSGRLLSTTLCASYLPCFYSGLSFNKRRTTHACIIPPQHQQKIVIARLLEADSLARTITKGGGASNYPRHCLIKSGRQAFVLHFSSPLRRQRTQGFADLNRQRLYLRAKLPQRTPPCPTSPMSPLPQRKRPPLARGPLNLVKDTGSQSPVDTSMVLPSSRVT